MALAQKKITAYFISLLFLSYYFTHDLVSTTYSELQSTDWSWCLTCEQPALVNCSTRESGRDTTVCKPVLFCCSWRLAGDTWLITSSEVLVLSSARCVDLDYVVCVNLNLGQFSPYELIRSCSYQLIEDTTPTDCE